MRNAKEHPVHNYPEQPRTRPTASFGAALLVGLFVTFGFPSNAFSRERGPRVDVLCPSAPIPVNIGDHWVLSYELHITNFDLVPLTLEHLDVFEQRGAQPLKSLSGDALAESMWHIGEHMGGKGSPTIAPGTRAVLFLWIQLPETTPTPASLHHRIVFATNATAGQDSKLAALEDFPVQVVRQSVPEISPPFDGGIWLAGDGPGNASPHRRTIVAIDGHTYSPERFAIDWIKVGPNGDSHHDGTERNENWWGYGEPIHAVADGEVTQVVDGIEENQPRVLPKEVTLDNIAGNYVITRISPVGYVTYAHLQKGSITVHPHQRIARGTVIGRLGNSGQATAPHLHFEVTDRDSVLESEGVPFAFGEFQYLGPGSQFEMNKHPSVRWFHSIPADDAVVQFDRLRTQPEPRRAGDQGEMQ